MSFLLRRTRQRPWGDPSRNREDAVREFERSDADTDGLSVFEIESEEDRLTIVAAIACDRGKCDPVDLIEVERSLVETYGPITATPEHGGTALEAANRKHCSLNWNAHALRQLAEDLFEAQVQPRRFSKADVRRAVCSIDPGSVIGESAQSFVRSEKEKTTK
jgi:hypothetical protein